MITPFVATLALLAPQEGRWIPTTVTPADLAKSVDRRLATLSNAKVKYQYDYDKSAVGHAKVSCVATIVSPKVFSIQIPRMDPTSREVANYEKWISDGKHFGWAVEPKQPVPGLLSKRPSTPAHPAKIWFTDFSRVIFSGVGQPAQPFSKLFAEARQLGFTQKIEVRNLTYRGQKIVSYRLTLAKGMTKYEIVIDGRGYLPVSVLNTVGNDASRWSGVDWNLRPGKELDAKSVRFIKSGPTKIFSPAPRRP